jgi:hypothetical protein
MLSHPGLTEFEKVTRCVPLRDSQRLSGIWSVGFEQSEFQFDASTRTHSKAGEMTYDLIVTDDLRKRAWTQDMPIPATYRLEFVGRQTFYSTEGGRKAIVVDKLLGIKRVGYAPQVPQ